MQNDKIQDDDLDDVLKIAAELSAHEGMPAPNLSHAKLHEAIIGPNAIMEGLITHQSSDAIAYILWNIGYDMQGGTKTLNIIDLFVRPNHRMKGVAKFLVKSSAAIARNRGYRFITVQTFDQNTEANGFYRACGAKLDNSYVYYFTERGMERL